MKIKATAVMVDAFAWISGPDGNVTQANFNISAIDLDDTSKHLTSAQVSPQVDSTLSIDLMNDAYIEAIITAIEGSTPGLANGWVVERDNLLVSGLFRRA